MIWILSSLSFNAQNYVTDDDIISDTLTGYLDPEVVVYKDSVFMAYALSNGNMWVGFVNPQNGLFISNYGKNRYPGGPCTPISVITNGPERRLDESAITGSLKERYDPESIVGKNELFVY